LGATPSASSSFGHQVVMRFHELFPKAKPIDPELAGASSFALAFLGMFLGSLLTPPSRENHLAQLEPTI